MKPLAAISFAEYDTTQYRPDVEFLDGVLLEKPMPSKLHAFVQMRLGHWFITHEAAWGVYPLSEVRTQVAVSRVRLPNIAVTSGVALDHHSLDQPPLIAIEILSEEDRMLDLEGRARDLERMGVHNIWLIDPVQRQGFIWGGAAHPAWLLVKHLKVENSPIHVDLAWLWTQIDRARQN